MTFLGDSVAYFVDAAQQGEEQGIVCDLGRLMTGNKQLDVASVTAAVSRLTYTLAHHIRLSSVHAPHADRPTDRSIT